jgi:hypothetical protein
MDEMEELKRIWKDTEQRLASLDGDQEREYEIINNHTDRKVLGKISIPVEYDEDEIIEKLQDEIPEMFDPEKDYCVSGDGRDGTIDIEESPDNDPNIKIAEMTTYEDVGDFDEFIDNVLDIERTQDLCCGKWSTKEYTIVTGTGGPHIEFTTGYQINVYWGGKTLEMSTYDDNARATIDRIEEYLNEIYQES